MGWDEAFLKYINVNWNLNRLDLWIIAQEENYKLDDKTTYYSETCICYRSQFAPRSVLAHNIVPGSVTLSNF